MIYNGSKASDWIYSEAMDAWFRTVPCRDSGKRTVLIHWLDGAQGFVRSRWLRDNLKSGVLVKRA